MAVGYATAGLIGFQLWNAHQQSDLILQSAELQSQIDAMNAEYAEIDAWNAERDGFTEAARYQTVIDQTIGEQRAIFAAQGVDFTRGTAAEVIRESKLAGFLNQLEIQAAGRKKAYGYKVEASNLRLGGYTSQIQSEINAFATRTAGTISAVGTGISAYERSQS